MTDITIPTENDVKLYKGLSIVSHTETSGYAIGSDLSFLLGIAPHGYIKNIEDHYKDYPSKTVPYLLSSVRKNGYDNQTFAANAYFCGYTIDLNEDAKKYGIRPMTDKSIIPPSMEIKSCFSKQYNCTIIEYGFYPQTAVNPKTNPEIIQQLNEMYKKKEGRTGNVYTFNKHPVVDSYGCTNPARRFSPWKHFEYELNGNRYVRVQSKVDNRFIGNRKNHKYWIKVEPIEWLLDEETGKMIARRALLSGISIVATKNGYDGNFKQSQLYHYLNTYFAEEMNQNNHLCTYNKDLLMSNFQQDFEKEIILPNVSTYQDNRIGFYNEVFKYTKNFAKRVENNQEEQNTIIMFAKNLVIQLTRNPELSLTEAFRLTTQKTNEQTTQTKQTYSDIRNFNPER